MAEVRLRSPGIDPVAREDRFRAVALFADIAGFTPMSEAFARSGNRGTEELTELLNAYFDRVGGNFVFDKQSGALLLAIELDTVSAAAPMTYLHDGKQYIVVAAGSGPASELIALSLP